MKKLVLVGLAAIALAACGNGEESQDSNSNTVQEQTEQKETKNDKGTRSNPYTLNDEIELSISYSNTNSDNMESADGKLKINFNNIKTGDEAQEFLSSENQFNEEAPEGYQWMVINTSAELLEGSEDFEYDVYLTEEIYDGKGNSIDNMQAIASTSNQLSDNSIFPGATAEGDISLLVPKDLDGAMMQLSNLGGGDTVWISLEQ